MHNDRDPDRSAPGSSSKEPPMTATATVRNGVPVDKLFATIDKVSGTPELARFRFTARNRWVEGTASESTIHEWHGAGADHLHVEEFAFAADHPTLGHGHGPTPQEYVLHALAACVVGGIATTAAARDIELRSVTTTVRGDIDVRGVLGIDPGVRNGYGGITMDIEVDADATPEQVEALVAGSRDHSAVFDIVTNPTPVAINVSS
jgi:uncharacterized OsmC-like protein